VYLDFAASIARLGRKVVEERYGNLFEMYERITGDNPYNVPMRMYPAVHYTMGGLWVDYHLMSTIPGLFVGGEANFSDHGANRLGASALMQGLADGYFILPCVVADYLATQNNSPVTNDHPNVRQALDEVTGRVKRLLSIGGTRSPDSFHRELGSVMWDYCGMARNEAGLRHAIQRIGEIRERFWQDLRILGSGEELNQSLEQAGRTADFLELGELMCLDALHRQESAGGHFREEFQTEEGEARRDDQNFSYVAAWQFTGDVSRPTLHRERLDFEYVKPSQRSYK
ncbi:MAG TPA: FAD-binding protein, partial [Polyangiaceae bacterium]